MKTSQQDLSSDVIQAAGGLLWRTNEKDWEVAVIHRPHYNDWTLPKGKMEPGESWQSTALREVREETCCIAMLDSFAGSVAYTCNGIAKVVLFWHMSLAQERVFKPNPEVDQLEWLSIVNALSKLEYSGERELIKRSRFFNESITNP